MARKIQHKRGLEANLPTLAEAEWGLTTDTEKPFIGGPNGNIEIAKKKDVDEALADKANATTVQGLSQTVNTKADVEYVEAELAKKADTTALETKADKEEVTTLSAQLAETFGNIGDVDKLGLIPRSIAETLAERGANVRDFGAVGDGVTDDSDAFKAAANFIGTGVVYIPKGTYLVESLPLRSGLYYIGTGVNSTILTLPDTPKDHMFKADTGLTDIEAGSVESVSLRGSKTTDLAAYNAFDFSTLNRLERFTIRDAKVEFFDLGYNGTANDRWAYIINTQFYNNRIAIYAGEHPILVNVDCRMNDVGLTGRLNDLTALNCRFNYNRVGAEPAEGGYINNSIFQNTGFWGNSEKGLEISHGNLITSARMAGLSTTTEDEGIVIAGNNNIISHVMFGQSEATSFGKGAIIFRSSKGNTTNNTIENNSFNLAGGVGIIPRSDSTTQDNIIRANKVFSNGSKMRPFIAAHSDKMFRQNTIQDNMFILNQVLEGSVIEIPLVYSGGNIITGNKFIMSSTTNIGYVLDIDARDSIIKDNSFMTHGQAVFTALYNFRNTNAGTVFKENKGIKAEARGTATIATGGSSVEVSHGLYKAPPLEGISVMATSDLGDANKFWVSEVNENYFTIRVDAAGGSVKSFAWNARV